MMQFDENLERLINRSLDGELSEAEQHELDCELIRNPEARALLERHQELDDLAVDTLRSQWNSSAVATDFLDQDLPLVARSYHRAWWLLPGAVAAALLAAVWILPGVNTSPSSVGDVASQGAPAPVRQQAVPVQSAQWQGGIIPVDNRPARTDRAIDRGYYGVRGSDGNIYLIEVERTRSRQQPGTGLWPRPVGGDL
ncbi:MAG: hypothetical protein GY842_09220 [bacterium]|nr:hypothetical protein [bacterium]